MKKLFKPLTYITIAAAFLSCAKTVEEGPNVANRRYFEAWMQVNYPDLERTGLGIYVIPTDPTGNETETKVEEDGFIYADYVITDLEGNISEYTDKNTAKQLGQYDTTYYYGPKVMTTIKETIPAGVAEAVIGMKVGERKKFIVPGWLMSYASYDTEEQYLNKVTNTSGKIYDITIREFTDSINKYEVEQIDKYIKADPLVFKNPVKPLKDTVFYYQQTAAPSKDEKKFENDTTIYINYTGKLLSGLVFDTTVEKVAKDNGLYSSSKSYAPVKVNWKKNWTEITMGSNESSVISGFALTLSQMNPMEKGIGVFPSSLGYSYSGSGKAIPGYSPLIFEIEIVAKPEE